MPVLRPVTAADLAMLEDWIGRPHWQAWWEAPTEEIAHIRDMLEGRDTTRPFIFMIDEQPAGYTQYWFVRDALIPEYLATDPWLTMVPEEAVGLDISIAEETDLSKGIGSAVIAALAQRLWAEGHREIIIDPDVDNARAIRAYEKAGFRTIEALRGKTGGVHLMKFDPANIEERTG